MKPQFAVFLDRDGTIIEDVHYAREPEKIFLLPGAGEALRLFASKGYLIFVVSNQSGVGRGIISDEQFTAVHEKFCDLLNAEGVEIAEFAYCFHHPDDNCGCRKPRTGLIPKAFDGGDFDFARCFTVGDSDCDLKLGENLGAKAFLVQTGKGKATAQTLTEKGELGRYTVCADLLDAAKRVPVAPRER